VHDTPLRTLDDEPEGLGLGTMDQVDPFHDSTSVSDPPDALGPSPTAVHAAGPVHDTPWRELSGNGEPGEGSGLGTMDQVVPFQDSTSVPVNKGPPEVEVLPASPTAVHDAGPVHETALRRLKSLNSLGLGTMDHVDPFQDSTSVWPAVPS